MIKKSNSIKLLVVLYLMLSTGSIVVMAATTEYKGTQGHFSAIIPDGYSIINSKTPGVDVVYQKKVNDKIRSIFFIADPVYVSESNIEEYSAGVVDGMKKSGVSNVEKATFDKTKNAIFINASAQTPNGSAKMFNVIFLGKTENISISYITSGDGAGKEDFDSVVNSFHFNSGYNYSDYVAGDDETNSLAVRSEGIGKILGGLLGVGLGIWIVQRLLRKKNDQAK